MEIKRWRLEDEIAGNKGALRSLREFLILRLFFPAKAGVKWDRGLLLHGPPGTGKTSLVRGAVREFEAHLTVISPHSVHRSHVGESEKVLRDAIMEASSNSKDRKRSVVFIDEIDALCPRRESRSEQDVRITSQLMVLMDSIALSSSHLVVIASTNRIDAVDPVLRRSGRFGSEIEVGVPSEAERLQILQLYLKNLTLARDVSLQAIASSCNGYVGADLEALCREAFNSASKGRRTKSELVLSTKDWDHAKAVVAPSITRGVSMDIPKVTWQDIGGLEEVKKKLQQAVEWPIKHWEALSRFGISVFKGVLLYGPPGCSKTTLVKAAANAANASFFSLSSASLYSMYVGEGEALLRSIFQRARLACPSIIFFDEIDAVAAKRTTESGGNEGLLTTLLTEMDGLEQIKGVLVLAATNRPEAIDPALRRPGRFDLKLYVPPPDFEARNKILEVHTRKMKLGADVDLMMISHNTELFTGADLECLCNEAGTVAIRENIECTAVYSRHFETVRMSMQPSISPSQLDSYKFFMAADS